MLNALLLSTLAASDHWAVLIAGSSGYGNYRHQADVCHAYQTVLAKGIPAENIITLAVDDIANSGENPFPGKMFNKPTAAGTPGKDVYAGCKIDWTGKDVTPANFVKVLTGDNSTTAVGNAKCSASQSKTCSQEQETCCCTSEFLFSCRKSECCASGLTCQGHKGCAAPAPPPPPPKVLGSGPDSKVFINFVDHGGVGIIGFPDTTMHTAELASALKTMADKKMYKELVFYLEACESGSMFPTGTLQPNMYATTAANGKESSWGTYCSPDDKVDGKSIGSCLGDLYSVNWMEDSDKQDAGETIEAQFKIVQTETNKSHVTEFGDKKVASEPLVNFQGDVSLRNMVRAISTSAYSPKAAKDTTMMDARDAELASAYGRFMASGSAASADELIGYVRDRKEATERFAAITTAIGINGVDLIETPEEIDVPCHYAAHVAYKASCGEWSTGALKHSSTLAKLCVATKGDAKPIRAAIQAACPYLIK